MVSPQERSSFIRFQLEVLAERNAHHDFEHICRRVVAARIASNLLPATGPVGSGGDRGRDFESYPTALRSELGSGPGFLGLASDERLAFICTIRRDGLRRKIEADLVAVAATASQVERVHAFLIRTLPIGQRNRVVDSAHEEHGIQLVVHDALYLAEQLAEPDLYWVAERYLDAPVEMAPEDQPTIAQSVPDWYLQERTRWRADEEPPAGMGALLELRGGLRLASETEAVRADLPFWLNLIRPLAGEEEPRVVRQRARYEIAMALFHSQGSIREADGLIRSYFAEFDDAAGAERLTDAGVLLSSTLDAAALGVTTITLAELSEIGARLRQIAAHQLDDDPSPETRLRLLLASGLLKMHIDPKQVRQRDGMASESERAELRSLLAQMSDETLTASDAVPRECFVDFEGAVEDWLELARELKGMPLVPVGLLVHRVTFLAPLLVDHPNWAELSRLVDDAVKRQQGQAAAAERSAERASALLDRGRVIEAIPELARARGAWWLGDLLRGSLLCTLRLGECYEHLALYHAAIQQYLTVAYLLGISEDLENRDLMPLALRRAARLEHRCGQWLAACELAQRALLSSSALKNTPPDVVTNQFLELLWGSTRTRLVALDMLECAAEGISWLQSDGGTKDLVAEAIPKERRRLTAQEWDRNLCEAMVGPPFVDALDQFYIRFAALGIRWTIRAASSSRDDVLAAQRFAAAAQMFIVATAQVDFCLPQVQIEVCVRTEARESERPDLSETVQRCESDGSHAWTVSLCEAPQSENNLGQVDYELYLVLIRLLMEVSLLPAETFQEEVVACFGEGRGKIGWAAPFDQLRRAFDEAEFRKRLPEGCRREQPADDLWPPQEAAELAWRDGPGLGYSREKSLTWIGETIEMVGLGFKRQLEYLKESPRFGAVVDDLRSRGWPNHLILTVVGRLTIDLHAAELGVSSKDPEALDAINRRIADRKRDPLDEASFNIETMEDFRRGLLWASAARWGLELHASPPNLDSVEELLAQRYGYWSDDSDSAKALLPGG